VIEQYATRFCGRWIRNFSKDNLDVSVVSGSITMSNVEVKTEEFQEMMSPFTPKFIYMGKLFVDIPLLPSRPLVVEISDLYFLLAAQDLDQVAPEAMTKALQVQVYVQFLQKKIQEALREEAEKSAHPGEWSKKQDSKFRLPHLVQQMRLNIKHVHMRIEATPPALSNTGAAGPSPPFFAFGTVTRELTMCSTCEEPEMSPESKKKVKLSPWQKLFGRKEMPAKAEEEVKDMDALDKVFVLKEVDVYWSNDNCYQDMPAELAVGLMRTGVSVTASVTPLLFQTSHLRIQTRIELNAKKNLLNNIFVEMSLGEVEMDLCNNQLEYFFYWFDYLWKYRDAMQLRSVGLSSTCHILPGSGGGETRCWKAVWHRAIGIVRCQVRRRWAKGKDDAARWRGYFRDWVIARRYVAIRELIQRETTVKTFTDDLGTVHQRLFEGLKADSTDLYQQSHQLSGDDVEVAERLLKGYIQQTIGLTYDENGNPNMLSSMRYALSRDMARALYSMQLDLDCTERLSLCAGARAIADSRVRYQALLADCIRPDQGVLIIRVLSADNMQPTSSWSDVEAICEAQLELGLEDGSSEKKLSTKIGYHNASQSLVTWNQSLRFLTPIPEEETDAEEDEEDFTVIIDIKSRLLMMDSSHGSVTLPASAFTSQPMDIVTHNIPLQLPAGLRLMDAPVPVLNLVTVYFPAGTDPTEIEPIERALQMMGTMDHSSLTGADEEEDPISIGHKGIDLLMRCLQEVKIKMNVGTVIVKMNWEDAHEEGSEPGFTPLFENRIEGMRAQASWKVQKSENEIKIGANRFAIIDHQTDAERPLLNLGLVSARIFAQGLEWRTLCLENPMLKKLFIAYFTHLPWDLTVQSGAYSLHIRDVHQRDSTKDLWQRQETLKLDRDALQRKRFRFFGHLTRLSTGQSNEKLNDGMQGAFLALGSIFRSCDFEVKYHPSGSPVERKVQRWSISSTSDSPSQQEKTSFGVDVPQQVSEEEKRKIAAERIQELEQEIQELKQFL